MASYVVVLDKVLTFSIEVEANDPERAEELAKFEADHMCDCDAIWGAEYRVSSVDKQEYE